VNRRALTLGLLALALAILAAPVARAAAPLYDVHATWGDTNMPPGGEGQFVVQVRNIGDGVGAADLTIEDQLPAGVTATAFNFQWGVFPGVDDFTSGCTGIGTETAKCTLESSKLAQFAPPPGSSPGSIFAQPTGYLPQMIVNVAISPSASGTGTNTATVSGGGAASASDVDQVAFSATPSSFGLVTGSFLSDAFGAPYPQGELSRQAGDHPFEQRVNFDLNAATGLGSEDSSRETFSNGLVRTVEVTLPRGFIGDPQALPKCDPADFSEQGAGTSAASSARACPANTQVGYLDASFVNGVFHFGKGNFENPNQILSRVPLYNLEPPAGTPVDLGFDAGGLVQGHIYATLDPAKNYAIKSVTPNISSLVNVRGSEVTLWGVPGDSAHDKFRYYQHITGGKALGAPFEGAIRPFFTNPMDCGTENGGAVIRLNSYEHPDEFTLPEPYGNPLNVEGCDDPRFSFKPRISLEPSDKHAGAPTGLDVHLEVPQRNEAVNNAAALYAKENYEQGISTPPIKKAVVTFPEGMTLSPSAAQGLGSCSSKQIELGSDAPVDCPDNSQYGTLTLHTPILPEDEQPEGFIYVAKQGDNPFHNFLALYLVIEQPQTGILVKLPGKAELDPKTGQITTTFDELPQFPVSDFQLTLKGGERAALVNPQTCGTKTIKAELFSWHDPATPHPIDSSYEITQRPDGSPCLNSLGERPFKPTLQAGTANNQGGSYSPFLMRLTRTDEDQEFSQLGMKLPEGLIGKLAGVGLCSDAGIAQALSRELVEGDGALELADPSCPASSQIGTTSVGAGVGVPLVYVPGKVYLAGPYKGAPLSVVVISPAVVGPYDLGVIAVRTALNIDPETTQVSAVTDPFPQIFQGIPVRIRDIRLRLDRPEFTLNPTDCAAKQIAAHITGTGGDASSTADDTAAELANRFQAADCAALSFRPALSFHLFGGTHRGAHPKLRATLKARGGDANIAGASVALPHSEFLDQAHIKTVCTRVQFAAKQCPAGSVYGYAVARTPLFDAPLQGPVYLRSSSHQLPDLVAELRGTAAEPIEVDLDGRIDSVKGGIRNTFEVVPDAPVTEFTLTMQGGKKGLLVNSTNLCEKIHRATANFTAQNGRKITLRPAMKSACGKGRHRLHK
jgi:hypothetical protein